MATTSSGFRIKEAIEDMVYVADVKEKPFIAMVKKGPPPKSISLSEYGVKSRGARKHGGVPDRKDVNAFDSLIPPDYLQYRSEVWRRAPMVGFIEQIEAKKGELSGTDDLWADARTEQIEELGRDMETELLSNQDSRPDDGINGLWTRGIGRWLHNSSASASFTVGSAQSGYSATADVMTLGTDATDLGQPTTGFAELAIPATYQTPANQIYTGAMGDGISTGFTEDVVKELIGNKWSSTGASSELSFFVTQALKNRFNLFADYTKNIEGATPAVQITSGRISGETLFGRTVDIYKSEWGAWTLHPEPTSFMPTAYTGYGLDMKQVRLRRTKDVTEKELPDLGGGPREFILAINGLEAGDPRAHIKINATA